MSSRDLEPGYIMRALQVYTYSIPTDHGINPVSLGQHSVHARCEALCTGGADRLLSQMLKISLLFA